MQEKFIEKEWQRTLKAEHSYLNRNGKEQRLGWQQKIAVHVPDKLEDTLNTAFCKAFELIFDKGTGIIEKTYQKEKKQQDYKINEYAAEVRDSRQSLRAFGRAANTGKHFNMAVSAVEGIGMGALGLGLPDIPLFLGVLLKSIYELALSYGFSYETEEEQIFILKMMEASLSHGDTLVEQNEELNLWMRYQEGGGDIEPYGEVWQSRSFGTMRSEQIRRTSDALSKELLYLKFVQGLPLVGVIGGISDLVYQKKISDYAEIKYRRRFLERKRAQNSIEIEQ